MKKKVQRLLAWLLIGVAALTFLSVPLMSAFAAADTVSEVAGPDAGNREPDAIDQPQTEEARKDAAKLEELLNRITIEPAALNSVEFTQVEGLMRDKNLQVRSFQESIDYLKTLDYALLSEELRKQLNRTAEAQLGLLQLANLTQGSLDSYAYQQLQQAHSALRDMFDDVKDGRTQRDNAGFVRQLRAYQDQIILGAESLFVTIADLENQRTALRRQLAALDRTEEEMTLRHELGQISDLQLREVQGGRAKLESGLATLEMNLKNLKYQLENLLGASLTGIVSLGGVPGVTEAELAGMDEDRDLASAKAASYELYAASKTLQTAEETYRDAAEKAGYMESNSNYRKAAADWKTAQNTYNATVQSFELKFRTLYSKVKDYEQVWKTAQVTLENQRASFQADQLKREQGTLSANALLTARDELSAAEDAALSAGHNLFSFYNAYRWAVTSGILN